MHTLDEEVGLSHAICAPLCSPGPIVERSMSCGDPATSRRHVPPPFVHTISGHALRKLWSKVLGIIPRPWLCCRCKSTTTAHYVGRRLQSQQRTTRKADAPPPPPPPLLLALAARQMTRKAPVPGTWPCCGPPCRAPRRRRPSPRSLPGCRRVSPRCFSRLSTRGRGTVSQAPGL